MLEMAVPRLSQELVGTEVLGEDSLKCLTLYEGKVVGLHNTYNRYKQLPIIPIIIIKYNIYIAPYSLAPWRCT